MRIVAVTVFIFALSCSLWAQGASSLRGTVTDAQKGVIPAAKVTLTDKEAGIARSSVTTGTGEYQFLQVRPGDYSVMIEAPGFATKQVENVKLLVDTPVTVDVSLEIASSASTVSVVEEISTLNTVDASVGNAFEEKQVQSLPLQTRNVVQLLSLQPGVTLNGEVMGARRDQNNILLDGVDNNDNQNPLSGLNGSGTSSSTNTTGLNSSSNQGFNSALPVPLDSVQEFRVTVAGEGATAGRASGGQVSLVTRSGTNELHGSAYEYNRNTDYTANNWFNNRSGVARPQLVRNQFGASLGGPVKKNRLFYFGNYERRIDSSQQSVTRTVPSDTLKQGIIQFKTTNGATYSLSPSDIAAIDPLHIGDSSTILSYLKQFPAINSPATGTNNDAGLNFGGFIFNAPVTLDYSTYVSKFDWVVDNAGKHTVSFRGTLSNNAQTQTTAQFPGQPPASQLNQDNRGFGVRYTALLSSTIDQYGERRPDPHWLWLYRRDDAFAHAWSGEHRTRITSRGEAPALTRPGISATIFTWVKSAHTITAGINFRWIDNQLTSYTNSYPSYSFSRGVLLGLGNDIYTPALNYVAAGNTAPKLSNSTAVTNAFETLLGLLNSYSATYQYQKDGSILPFGMPRLNDFITHNYEAYVQDSWKVNPKLTVTYGLHYEFDTVPYEANGLQVATTPGLNNYFAARVAAANAGIPGNQIANSDEITYALNGPVNGKSSWYKPDTNNFAPRLSVAYALNSKTVFRAGAGMTYDQYGNDLVASVSSLGSVGLSTALGTANFL